MRVDEFYTNMGVNYQEILRRLMNEKLILRFLRKFYEAKEFKELKEAIENKNIQLIFRSAHTIKGNCLNLGLEPLGTSVGKLSDTIKPYKDQLEINDELMNLVIEQFKQVQIDYDTVINNIKLVLELESVN
jgi:chemotaxis protein histidine kinase CheA